MQIKKHITPNFTLRPYSCKIAALVLHQTAGAIQGALAWIKSEQSRVSYHFIVDKQGIVHQLVDANHCAWHAGVVKGEKGEKRWGRNNPNSYTIGVAVEILDDEEMTPHQHRKTVDLLIMLCAIYNLIPKDDTIVFHREIRDDKTCPGNIDKEKLIEEIKQRMFLSNVQICTGDPEG